MNEQEFIARLARLALKKDELSMQEITLLDYFVTENYSNMSYEAAMIDRRALVHTYN